MACSPDSAGSLPGTRLYNKKAPHQIMLHNWHREGPLLHCQLHAITLAAPYCSANDTSLMTSRCIIQYFKALLQQHRHLQHDMKQDILSSCGIRLWQQQGMSVGERVQWRLALRLCW